MEILKQTSSTREDLGMLAVMEALERQEQITQREMAQMTGLNLKKVNYCLHKLLEKGHVKFQRVRDNPDKRAYLYILTPSGLKAKSQLTYNFLKFTFDFYNKVEDKLRRCLLEMVASGTHRIALYGASDVARILLGMVEGLNLEVVGVVGETCPGHDFHGVPIIRLEHLAKMNWDTLLVTDLEGIDEVEECLQQAGIDKEKIWKLS